MSETDSDELEDLRDQIHDLEQDLKDADKDIVRLEAELAEMYKDDGKTQIRLKEEIKDLNAAAVARSTEITRLEKIAADLDKYLDTLRVNYIKALSVSESLKTNGNMDYFKTNPGRQLLAWADEELKREASKIMKEET